MKTLIKYSSKFAFALALCVMILSGCSCRAPKATPASDPLVGFHVASKNPDQVIVDDYQNYIHTLSPEDQKFATVNYYYEDGTGQHAIQIEVLVGGKDSWDHYLFYDKNNKRIKVEKIHRGRYWNP